MFSRQRNVLLAELMIGDTETTVDWTQPAGFDPKRDLKNMPGRQIGSGTIALQAHDPKSVTFYKEIWLKITD